MEPTPTNEGEKVKIGATWVASFGVRLWGRRSRQSASRRSYGRFSNYSFGDASFVFVTLVEESERREKARDFITGQKKKVPFLFFFSSFALTKM